MKKVFIIRDFNKAKDVKHLNPLILAYRKKNTVHLQNMEALPSDKMRVEYDIKSNEVRLCFKLNETEFLGLGDDTGMAAKTEIKGTSE
jgi:hypothetical protein